MYANNQLRWAGPSGNYAQNPMPAKTSAHKRFLGAFAVVSLVLFAGTNTVVNVLANNQVEYKTPAITQTANQSPEKSTAVTTPPQQSPAAQPAIVAEPEPEVDSSAKVQAVLSAWAASHSAQQWSVSVQGLGSDKTNAAINSSAKYDPASVFKLYFTYTLFQNYTLDSLTKNFVTIDGKGAVSMKDCLDLMIKNSDNPCGAAMGNRLGWGKTNTALKKLGMINTDLNNPNGLTTSSADASLFLQKLNNGELMDEAEQQYVLSLMKQQIFRRGIPASCSGCVVANKTGDLGFVRHDVGIVQYPGGSYVLSIMTNGASYSQMAQLAGQVQAAIDSN